MDREEYNYEPLYSSEAGNNFALYYCPVCDLDTLHQVLGVDFDNYDIRCSKCGTSSMVLVDNFDSYEEEALRFKNITEEFMG